MRIELKKRIADFLLDESGGFPIKKSSAFLAIVVGAGLAAGVAAEDPPKICDITSIQTFHDKTVEVGGWINKNGPNGEPKCDVGGNRVVYFQGTLTKDQLVSNGFPDPLPNNDFFLPDGHFIMNKDFDNIWCGASGDHVNGDDHVNGSSPIFLSITSHQNELSMGGDNTVLRAEHSHEIGSSFLSGYSCHASDHSNTDGPFDHKDHVSHQNS